MKNRNNWLVVILFMVVLIQIGWTGHAQRQSAVKKTWEYHSMSLQNWGPVQQMGTEGWELAFVYTQGEGARQELYGIFKREK